ncbi:hypothetical protein NQ314_000198 [Rhamnusium bicolor]|uniref:Mitotic checkpoint protein and poly(A)+ RNA export protein n=1 Tax=Rhamnusium bicolor TaxID=1586634 RepID=A0AAV8ZYW6_9CUCU|nr:hypothetical protein NQ314_000198 [Rhamnusium bicolor]
MFNQSALGGFGATATPSTANPMKDFEVAQPPDDSVSSLAFSPATLPQNFLIAGSWDNNVSCWEIEQNGSSVPKSMQSCGGPVLDVAWSDDGTKVFKAGCDKQAKMWDLASNQVVQVAMHDAPIKTCHWIKAPNYSYVDFPMAVVGTAGRQIIVYQLEGKPQEYKKLDSPLKYQHRCVAIFRDKKKVPTGYALGSVEGRVAIQYVNPTNPKDNFTFKCHRSNGTPNGYQDIYAVNDIAFHPIHGTLATVGADGSFSFWDKDARTKLKPSELMEQPITRCAFNHNGQIFAYSVSYDWSRGHEFYNTQKKNYIFLRSCYEELKPRTSS